MTDYFAHYWNNLSYLETAFFSVVAVLGVSAWRLRSKVKCPQCSTRLEKVDGRPSLNQRLMNLISINGRLDARLENKTFYTCSLCDFETIHPTRLALYQKYPRLKPADSKSTSFK